MTERTRYLLDTNVLSESRKKRPNLGVFSFFEEADLLSLHVSVLTLGELRKGAAIKAKADPGGAEKLGEWIDALERSFADRILPIDRTTARIWGELCVDRSRPAVDTLLAATAIAHVMTLVTRNTKDILGIELNLLNPWNEV